MKKILMLKIRYRKVEYNDDFKLFMKYSYNLTHTMKLIFNDTLTDI